MPSHPTSIPRPGRPSTHPFPRVLAPALLSCLLLSSLAIAQTPPPPPTAQSAFQHGLQLQHTGHLAEAEQAFEQAHALAPADRSITTALARLEAVLGRNPDSIRLFRELAAASPRDSESQINLAVALASAGSLDEALESATRATTLNPRSTAAHHLRGKILSDLHRSDDARTEFDTALKLNPADPLTLYDAALLAEDTGRLPEEVSLLQRLNRVVPGRAPYHFLLARALARTGDIPASRAEYRETIRLDPEHRAAVYSLSRSLQTDDPAEAARLTERFRALRVSDEELNSIRTEGNAGVAAMGRKDWPVAIASFQAALATCAGCTLEATLEKDLGLAQCQAGDPVAGAAALHRSLALNPRDLDALQALRLAEKAFAPAP